METSNRRDFLKNAAIAGTAAGMSLTTAGLFPGEIIVNFPGQIELKCVLIVKSVL